MKNKLTIQSKLKKLTQGSRQYKHTSHNNKKLFSQKKKPVKSEKIDFREK